MKLILAVSLVSALSGCMPQEVWRKAGADTLTTNQARSTCYAESEKNRPASEAIIYQAFEACMKNAGYQKAPQWN
jgi:hypothetical protein